MIGIGDFFKRIKGLHAREVLVRTIIQDAIKKHTGVDIPLDSISFSAGSIVLKSASNSLRSAIFIKKTAILADVNAGQDLKKIVDIR